MLCQADLKIQISTFSEVEYSVLALETPLSEALGNKLHQQQHLCEEEEEEEGVLLLPAQMFLTWSAL